MRGMGMKKNISNVWLQAKESIIEIWKTHPYLVVLWFTISLVMSVIPAINIWLQKAIIDNITILCGNKKILIVVITFLLLTHLLKISESISMLFTNYISTVINTDLTYEIKKSIGEKCIKLPLYFFDDSLLYDRIKMAIQSLSYN